MSNIIPLSQPINDAEINIFQYRTTELLDTAQEVSEYINTPMDFPDKWAAIVWICRNQLGKRNLTDEQKTYLIGKEYEAQKMTQGGNTKTQHDASGKFTANLQSEGKRSRGTAEKVAEAHGSSVTSVERAARFASGLDSADKIAPGFRESILTGIAKAPKSVLCGSWWRMSRRQSAAGSMVPLHFSKAMGVSLIE